MYANRRNPPKQPHTISALAQIEGQLGQLASGFETLDALRAEEQELATACQEAAAQEKAVLEDQDSTEKQATERLLKVRALRDVRDARLANTRKRIVQHLDLLRYDLCEPLRRSLTNLGFALLAHCRQRIEKLFFELLGNGVDHGLPVSTTDLTQRSKPVLDLQRFCNSVRDVPKDPQQQFTELRSDLPRSWLTELHAVIEVESNA
jgi:hypothetical protein